MHIAVVWEKLMTLKDIGLKHLAIQCRCTD